MKRFDYLKFVADLGGHEDAEDDYTLVSLHQAQDTVLPVSEDPLAALSSGNMDIEDDETSPTLMPLLDEDSFWV